MDGWTTAVDDQREAQQFLRESAREVPPMLGLRNSAGTAIRNCWTRSGGKPTASVMTSSKANCPSSSPTLNRFASAAHPKPGLLFDLNTPRTFPNASRACSASPPVGTTDAVAVDAQLGPTSTAWRRQPPPRAEPLRRLRA
ncbi:hypothetical protein DFH11DRAFT_1730773 [Phellopilus nigrolimitatus]|nr:hypothetical protein DFH11DRAFT_1730773 [Phellopilus nigrolimitatus]